MGDFLLAMAKERAQKAGVKARSTVRSGVFSQVLREVIDEYPLDTIVLGSSGARTGHVTTEYLCQLAKDLGSATGIEVIILFEGEVVCTYPDADEADVA